jgi:hypothetical protein
VQEHLIIFTRYPEPGKAKTRLIPALGAEGAAELHRRMTEHTIGQARYLAQHYPVSISVYFTGGTVEQMQDWLGQDLHYRAQSAGGLGDRLIDAFQNEFDHGATSAIAIGTDCPELNAALLTTGFEKLKSNDVVLGVASDGGYYLIGLRHPIPELFHQISWSTDIVFQQTLEIVQRLNLSIATLPMLNDIDRPEDLVNLYQK